MKPEDYGYVVKNNVCLFQKGPLSQWWGGFEGQQGGFYIRQHELIPGVDFIHDSFDFRVRVELLKDQKRIHINCCEQYMMLLKACIFKDFDSFKLIYEATSPQVQKDLGRGIKNFNPELWDEKKFEVVYYGNLYKFSQNEELKNFLLSFHPHTIFAEAAPWDKVWGIGMDQYDPRALDVNTWQGENLLGKAITMVRDQLLF